MLLMFWSRTGGLGAGIGTGLAGLSAALIIAPSLMTFCSMPALRIGDHRPGL